MHAQGAASEFVTFLNRDGSLPTGHSWLFVVGGFLLQLPARRHHAARLYMASSRIYHGAICATPLQTPTHSPPTTHPTPPLPTLSSLSFVVVHHKRWNGTLTFAGTLGTSSDEPSVSHNNIASALLTKQIVVDVLTRTASESNATPTSQSSSTAIFNDGVQF